MRQNPSKTFLSGAAGIVFFAVSVFAANHHSLNGTWQLIPGRSDFAGGNMIQAATITINDREGNIYISRHFTSENENTTATYTFDTDGRANSTIRKGETFKSKTKWEGGVLKVTTNRDNGVETESYSLQPDGILMLTLNRPDGRTMTLYFQRQ
jgi:hypothetical protein